MHNGAETRPRFNFNPKLVQLQPKAQWRALRTSEKM